MQYQLGLPRGYKLRSARWAVSHAYVMESSDEDWVPRLCWASSVVNTLSHVNARERALSLLHGGEDLKSLHMVLFLDSVLCISSLVRFESVSFLCNELYWSLVASHWRLWASLMTSQNREFWETPTLKLVSEARTVLCGPLMLQLAFTPSFKMEFKPASRKPSLDIWVLRKDPPPFPRILRACRAHL